MNVEVTWLCTQRKNNQLHRVKSQKMPPLRSKAAKGSLKDHIGPLWQIKVKSPYQVGFGLMWSGVCKHELVYSVPLIRGLTFFMLQVTTVEKGKNSLIQSVAKVCDNVPGAWRQRGGGRPSQFACNAQMECPHH